MIERFFSNGIKELGTVQTAIYTAPNDMNTAFVTGLFISNITDRNTSMEVYLYQKKTDRTIVISGAETPLPAGSTAAIASLGQRLQLTPGDKILVTIGHDKAADALISVSEIIYSKYELDRMKENAKETAEENE